MRSFRPKTALATRQTSGQAKAALRKRIRQMVKRAALPAHPLEAALVKFRRYTEFLAIVSRREAAKRAMHREPVRRSSSFNW